jgi:hypothetical protein
LGVLAVSRYRPEKTLSRLRRFGGREDHYAAANLPELEQVSSQRDRRASRQPHAFGTI